MPTDRCEVSSGSGDATLYRGVVLAPDGAMPRGEVVTEGDRIACVDSDCASEFPNATIAECGAAVISPALVNPHEHMRFNELGPHWDLGDERYDNRHEWRGELSTPNNPSGTGRNSTGMRWNELRQLIGGTTSVIGSGRASGIVRHLDDLQSAEREQGFRQVVYETFPLDDSDSQFADELIPPESCEGWNFEHDAFSVSQQPAYLPHMAEGIDPYAADEFRCQSQDYADGGRDFAQPNASFIHSIGLDAVDFHRMARAGTRLVWSPRTNIALYGVTADVSTFHRFGGTIALGTDWAYTGSANMLRELTCADSYNRDYLNGIFTDRELWEMATINAAISGGNDHVIGSLEEEKVADILVVDGAPGDYRAVLDADSEDVLLVTRDGEPFFGDADILDGLIGDRCDPIDVCGNERGVCLSRNLDDGTSYSELASSVSDDAYPVFFCGDPPDEPTCVPSRPGEFTGIASDEDSVGDGIPDSEDLCPEVFHPIRPIDDGAQQDADGDGAGDPCDEEPVPSDISGDGVPNDEDLCPYDHNPAPQQDSSGDGKGDVCDACPDVHNPHTPCPPDTVTTIRDIHTELGDGDDAVVLGAVVTGIFHSGATIQDPDPDGANPEQSGLTAFTGSRPAHLEVGDLVNAVGEKSDHFGNVELGLPATLNPVDTGLAIEPTEVSVAEAASDAYQGVLVEITSGEASSQTYDCSQDDENCSDDGLWEIQGDGGESIVVYDRLYDGDDWDDHVGELPIRGVVMFRFGTYRLMPRGAADFP